MMSVIRTTRQHFKSIDGDIAPSRRNTTQTQILFHLSILPITCRCTQGLGAPMNSSSNLFDEYDGGGVLNMFTRCIALTSVNEQADQVRDCHYGQKLYVRHRSSPLLSRHLTHCMSVHPRVRCTSSSQCAPPRSPQLLDLV